MLDGHSEIGEENSVGLKSLKDGIYLKAANKVDFENWWKELSTFVPSPMKRAQSELRLTAILNFCLVLKGFVSQRPTYI